jgi:hypothetical protein
MAAIEDSVDVSSRSSQGRGARRRSRRSRHTCYSRRPSRRPRSKPAGYAVSQRIRKRVEEIFGWMKTVGGYRKTRYVGFGANQVVGMLTELYLRRTCP